jgi:hypothetical protein
MLRQRFRLIGSAVVMLAVGAGVLDASAQSVGRTLGGTIKFNSGQSVQPIFDGWAKNPDGSFDLYFGYLNRNYVEEPNIPIGPENALEPSGPDRGQPTYFYTRFNRRAFTVMVPKDWDKKEVVWTLTTHGKTERAVGWLQPEWEIDRNERGSASNVPNQPPTIQVTAASRVSLPATLTLTATVTDDGQPPIPKPRRGGTSENPPTFHPPGPTFTAPVNVPQVERPRRLTVPDRLSVTWIVWRGPGAVVFNPPISGADKGNVVATATFSKPGEYVLRARASDPSTSTPRDVKVTVDAPAAASRP